MKKSFAALGLLLLATQVTASPHIPGKQSGIRTLGTPAAAPEPTPTPAPLVPGSTPVGSWAATSAPAMQGSGSTFRTVAQWSNVPREPLDAVNNEICVVAGSPPKDGTRYAAAPNDMAKVRFIADNGSPVDITTPTTSGIAAPLEEFCTNIDLTGKSAGSVVEIRAIAYPTNGEPVVLQGGDSDMYNNYWGQLGLYSLFIQANRSTTRYYVNGSGGNNANNCTASGTACATISGAYTRAGTGDQSSVEICLASGSYSMNPGGYATYRQAASGYLTITSCGTGTKSNVTITGWDTAGSRAQKTRLKSLKISDGGRLRSLKGANNLDVLWLDDVDWVNTTDCRGRGNSTNTDPLACPEPINVLGGGYWGGQFYTDTKFENFHDGPKACTLCRNVTVNWINSDAFQYSRTVLVATVTHMVNCCSVHADVNQQTGSKLYNHIFAGVTATLDIDGQGIFNDHAGGSDPNGNWIYALFMDNTIDNSVNASRYVWRPAAGGKDIFFLRQTVSGGPIGTGSTRGDDATWFIVDSDCSGAGAGNLGSGPATTYFGSASCQ